MSYKVLARRYRPAKFSDIVGQKHVVTTLLNAVSSDRVAHAYLFCGSRGVGKTSAARIFAKTLNCPNKTDNDPCCKCDACRGISEGDDIDVIEMDAASNRGIDDIRSLRENAIFRPARSPFKIYIIDEIHMLTREAFNALLKTLEEPPEYVKFVFCTTEPDRIPATILSRCQRFDFHRLVLADIVAQLTSITSAEGYEISDEALTAIARYARGGLRDSISVLEQLFSFTDNRIELTDVQLVLGAVSPEKLKSIVFSASLGASDVAIRALNNVLDSGRDTLEVLDQLIEFMRDCMLMRECPGATDLLAGWLSADDLSSDGFKSLTTNKLLLMMNYAWWARPFLKEDSSGRTPLEISVIRMAHIAEMYDIPDLIRALGKTGIAILNAEKSGDLAPLPASLPKIPDKPVEAAIPIQRSVRTTPTVQTRHDEKKADTEIPSGKSWQIEELWYSFCGKRPLGAMVVAELRSVRALEESNKYVLRASTKLTSQAMEIVEAFRSEMTSGYSVEVAVEITPATSRSIPNLSQIRAHPAVTEVLELFPGATVENVISVDELEK